MSKRLEVGDKVTYAPRGIIGTIGGYMSGYYRVEYTTGWVDVRDDAEELRLVEWTTLAELRPGTVFETEEGIRGCKCFQPDWMLTSYVSLDNGKMVVVRAATIIKVRELSIL